MDAEYEAARLRIFVAAGPAERPKRVPLQFMIEWDRTPVPPAAAARAEQRLVGALARLLDEEGP